MSSDSDYRRWFAFYKWTSIYLCICLTVIVILLIRGSINS